MQEELEEVTVAVLEGEVSVLEGEVLVGSFLDGSGVGMLSLPMVMTGHEGKGGGTGGG